MNPRQFKFDPNRSALRQLTAGKLEAIRRQAVQAEVTSVKGARVAYQGPGGTVLSVLNTPAPSVPPLPQEILPFNIKDVSDEDGVKVEVRFGAVRNVLVATFTSAVLTAGTYTVWLDCDTTTGGVVNAAAVIVGSAPPADGDESFSIILGEVEVDGDPLAAVIRQYRWGSFWHQRCVSGTEEDPIYTHLVGQA